MKTLTLNILSFLIIVLTYGQNGGLKNEINSNLPVNALAFLSDSLIISGGSHNSSEDKSVELTYWNTNSDENTRQFPKTDIPFETFAFGPKGDLLAGGTSKKNNNLYLIKKDNTIYKFIGHTDGVNAIDFSPDGHYIVSASSDKTVRVWDVFTKLEVKKFQGHIGEVLAVDYSQDGRFVASGGKDENIKIWDIQKQIHVTDLTDDFNSDITCLQFSNNGKFLISGSSENTIKLWYIGTKKVIRDYLGHKDKIKAIEFSPDGFFIASLAVDNEIKIWDKGTAEDIYTLKGKEDSDISSISFSPNSKELAIGYGSNEDSFGTIEIYDIQKPIAEYYMYDSIGGKINNSTLFNQKDEFESTIDYKIRMKEAKVFKQELYEKYYTEVIAKKEENKKLMSEKIKKSKEEIFLRIEYLGFYDADNEEFPISINGKTLNINVPLTEAKSFKQKFDTVIVIADKIMLEDGKTLYVNNIRIKNPDNENTYSFDHSFYIDEVSLKNYNERKKSETVTSAKFDEPPKPLSKIKPVYPDKAKGKNIMGKVYLKIYIDETGEVKDAIVLQGIPELNQAAVDAVKKVKYEPAKFNEKKVAVWVTVGINFSN